MPSVSTPTFPSAALFPGEDTFPGSSESEVYGITAFDLIQTTKRHLGGMQREVMNKLAAPVSPEAGSLTLQYDVSQIQSGSYLQVGLELFYVWTAEPASKTVVVEPAQLGSPTALHDQGDIVTVNPKFPDFAILQALNEDLLDLGGPSNGVYAVRELYLRGSYDKSGYDLPVVGDLQDVLSVMWRTEGSGVIADWVNVTNWEVGRRVSKVDFPSGHALFIHDGIPDGRKIRVQYRSSITPLVGLTDDVINTGLPRSAVDIPPMGAAVRLVAPREIKRNFTEAQGDSRRAAEVGPGAVAQSMRAVAAMRSQRIQAEAARLAQQYPIRSFIPMPSMGSEASRWSRWR